MKMAKRHELNRLFQLQNEMEPELWRQELGLKNKSKSNSLFKLPTDDERVFSNYFAPIIVCENGKREIIPMRYRVRPEGSKEEVPAKYNVFNARLDSLETRQTWQNLFMRRHGIVPMKKFFEWVEGPEKRPKLISFYPDNSDLLWAPCLYDEWISKTGKIHFKSFAIITDGPPKEIEEMGHDRCPIFLKKDLIDEWLNPVGKKKKDFYQLLSQKEETFYKHQWM